MLLRVNHERDGRTDGRRDRDDGNMGKATFGYVSPKKYAFLCLFGQIQPIFPMLMQAIANCLKLYSNNNAIQRSQTFEQCK